MLSALYIENFAIVSKLSLNFANGMTAFTGETGAGKSIMIDALLLALGGRGDASSIRSGEEKCEISASFKLDTLSKPAVWLSEHAIEWDEEVTLRRVLYAEGRSKSFINGYPFPLQKIKELSELLVDIHGQHQHQSLLKTATHREQLDRFSNHQSLLQQVQSLYYECQEIKESLAALAEAGSSKERMTLLQYQLEELAALSLQPGEMQRLSEEHQLLHHAYDYLKKTQNIANLLQGEGEFTLCQCLTEIIQDLKFLPSDQANIKNAREMINTALIQCEEALAEIRAFESQVQIDPDRLLEVEERMGLLHQTARKYRVDANQLTDQELRLKEDYQLLKDRLTNSEQLTTRLAEKYEAFEKACQELRESRKKAAPLLAKEISRSMRELGMPKGYIEVQITPMEKMHAHGMDKVEYLVCTNPGMPLDELTKVASGGELSRISLAIHMITAERGSTPTLLFDEVDVGIGGATAAKVGRFLRKLSERLQLFCVTHQPQVAACAHHHFAVEKYTLNSETFSRIHILDEKTKVNEIARMLGGLTITAQSRSHAEALIEESMK